MYGALGGVVGAACMTAVRMAARRRGLIDKMVSQAAEEWLTAHTDVPVPREPALHHALDQVLHFGYGGTLGLAYALAPDVGPTVAAAGWHSASRPGSWGRGR